MLCYPLRRTCLLKPRFVQQLQEIKIKLQMNDFQKGSTDFVLNLKLVSLVTISRGGSGVECHEASFIPWPF